jgi:hypothetical protein
MCNNNVAAHGLNVQAQPGSFWIFFLLRIISARDHPSPGGKNMRFLIVVAAAFMAASNVAQAASDEFQIRHTADLIEVCTKAPSEPDYASAIAFCHGILVGAYGYYNASTPAGDRFVCATQPYPKRSKVMNDFVAWAKNRPQHMPNHSIDTLFTYLAEA